MESKIIKETALHNENVVSHPRAHPVVPVLDDYLHAATSHNTRKAYQADIRHFIQWGGLLPTTAQVVIQYLREHAEHLNPRTLTRRLTAIKQWHLYQGFSDPTSNPLIRKTLTGIKNIHGKPKEKAPPLTLEALTQMVTLLKSSLHLRDCRNAALLLIGFFGAFRRSELVNITWEDVRFVPEGVEIVIPRSKTDQAGEGQVCAIPYGGNLLCPVTALLEWREKSHCSEGAVFPQVMKNRVSQSSIKPLQVNTIIKSLAKACNMPNAENYSSHSLRRGFATEASKQGAPFGSIMRQGRWRHEGTVLGYMDEGKRFQQNAAGVMLGRERGRVEAMAKLGW